ncbi:MAG: response regulator [Syntrophaceticus sp.]
MDKKDNTPLILLVEDNEVHIRLMCDLLLKHGMNVISCTNPGEVISLIHENKPDLILMDISLKEMSGLELTQKIKKTPSIANIPVIALTAHATKQDKENAMSVGFSDYIVKPINTRLFPQKIASFLQD